MKKQKLATKTYLYLPTKAAKTHQSNNDHFQSSESTKVLSVWVNISLIWEQFSHDFSIFTSLIKIGNWTQGEKKA